MTPELLTDIVWFALAFSTALGLSLFITPLTIRVASKFGIVDKPDGRLKKHETATPYLGGLAVAASFVIAFGVLTTPQTTDYQAMGILTGCLMVLLLGLYDDLGDLSPSVKFLGQLLAAVVIYKGGVQVDIASLPEWVNLALTLLWVTGVANAFNIIDVMDGLAAGTAMIASMFLFVIALVVEDRQTVPFMSITLLGALAGYLRFNFRPARIFLGDTGSLFIGFMIASLSMVVSYTDHNRLALAAPVVLLSVPIFDTVFVAVHRARKGIPFFRGSPDHFALRLRHAGWTVPQIVLRTYVVASVLGLLALGLVFGPLKGGTFVLGIAGLLWAFAFLWLSRKPAPTKPPLPKPTQGES